MAEIEYFVDPECKDHPKFDSVADLHVRLYSRDRQMAGEAAVDVTLREAIDKVSNLSFLLIRQIYYFCLVASHRNVLHCVAPNCITLNNHVGSSMHSCISV